MFNRKILVLSVFLGLSSIITFHTVSTGIETSPSGLVTYVDGTLKKKYSQTPDWVAAAKDTTVISGEKVRTFQNSRAELELMGEDIIRLAPRTVIDIIKLFEETKEQKDQTSINVEEGELWAMVGSVEAGAEFDLSTPVAGAAITGTIFRVAVDEDSSTELKVYKGEVQISNNPDNPNLTPEVLPHKQPKKISGPKQVSGPRQVTLTEWLYIVRAMQSLQIDRNGNVVDSRDFSLDDRDEQTDWVKWNKERDEARMKRN